jgi:hypothetical protein
VSVLYRLSLVLALLSALSSAGAALAAEKLDGVSGERHAWLFVKQEWRGDNDWDLYHESATAPPGTLTRVMPLPGRPIASAAGERRVILVYPAKAGPDGESVRPVRSLAAVAPSVGDAYRYSPSGRAKAESPLPGSGVLIGFGYSPEGPAALLRPTTTSGSGRLLVLTGALWREQPLPEGLSESERWRLDEAPGGLILRAGKGAWVWDDESGWRQASIAAPAEARLLASGQQLLAAEWSERGVELTLLRGGQAYDLAAIEGVPEEHVVVCVAEAVTAYWFDADEPNRLRAATVSSISGETLFAGLVGSPSPLRQEDLQLISLVAGSVLLIIILFLLRPEGELHAEPTVPEWAALAEPGPRMIAALVDIIPAAGISALLWGIPIWAAVSPGLAIETSQSLMPIFTTAGIFFLHSALSEWLTGRTLGKALTGLRTIDSRGEGRGPEKTGLRIRQATVRNLFKAVFPPLTILLLLDPARRHPADQVSATVVVGRARRAEGDDKNPEGES